MTAKAASAPLLMDDGPATANVALTTQPAANDGLASVIERLAANPQVDVVKLEKIIEHQERIMRHNAKAAFDAAFARMGPDIPQIDEKGKIVVKGVLRSTYARLEDIHEVIKSILGEHGFAMRHRTEWPADKPGIIRIVGILSHEQGHSEESCFEAKADSSDFRTDIQSQGSTVTYGRRYTTLDLLNIATRAQDNDGATAGRPQPPNGYEDWWTDLTACADNGTKAMEQAWSKSKPEFKTYTVTANKSAWEALKAKATRVAAS